VPSKQWTNVFLVIGLKCFKSQRKWILNTKISNFGGLGPILAKTLDLKEIKLLEIKFQPSQNMKNDFFHSEW